MQDLAPSEHVAAPLGLLDVSQSRAGEFPCSGLLDGGCVGNIRGNPGFASLAASWGQAAANNTIKLIGSG